MPMAGKMMATQFVPSALNPASREVASQMRLGCGWILFGECCGLFGGGICCSR